MPQLQRYAFDRLVSPRDSVLAMRQRHHDIPVHWHDYYELVHVVDGEGTHWCNGIPEPVTTGSTVLLGPTDFHAFDVPAPEPLTCYNVVIDPRIAETHLLGLLPVPLHRGPWSVAGFEAVRADFDRLWRESTRSDLGAARLREAVLTTIFVAFARRLVGRRAVRGAGREDRYGAGPDSLHAALSYVDRHFREPLTLAQVAAQSCLSPNYFSERFHQMTGLPFKTYLQQARLRFARSLLRSTRTSVTDAALASGFNGVSHFGRAYRARYGRAPSIDRLCADDADPNDQAVA